MSYKAVIFDLDGTLLDTLNDLADSMNAALDRFSLPTHPIDAYRTFVGDGIRALTRRVSTRARDDAAFAGDLLAAMGEEYAMRWNSKTRPYDGVDEMLSGLAGKGLAMAVLSNKPHEFTCKCVSRLLADHSFAIVQGVNETTPRKPELIGVNRIIDQLGESREELMYVGDTNTDMQTARAAGLFAVGVCWGFRPAEELEAAGANVLINHPSELLDLIADS